MRAAFSGCRGTSGTAAALVKSRPKSLAVERTASISPSLSGQDPRTGREVDSACLKCVIRDFDIETGQAVTRREQFLLTCVSHQEDGAGASDVACGMRLLSQRSEGGRAHRRIRSGNCLQMIMRG